MLDFDTCNAARLRRDPSFDGVFFTAVRTTGIYCRPVCPVKQPLTKNVSYYPSAAAAEQAGYRPCLRCRPETAPFCPAWNGTRTTVERAVRMIEDAAQQGIGHKVLFTGFLRGRDVDRVFQMADCYVMPSVSEPFGIAPLEAMRNDTPVIVSKQSGVSEVLTHALKVDFWDIDEMANKIVAVLRYPPLSSTLREHGRFELRGLSWDGAAEKCVRSYARAIADA